MLYTGKLLKSVKGIWARTANTYDWAFNIEENELAFFLEEPKNIFSSSYSDANYYALALIRKKIVYLFCYNNFLWKDGSIWGEP